MSGRCTSTSVCRCNKAPPGGISTSPAAARPGLPQTGLQTAYKVCQDRVNEQERNVAMFSGIKISHIVIALLVGLAVLWAIKKFRG